MGVSEMRKRQRKIRGKKWYRIILNNFTEAEALHFFFCERCILHFFYEVGAQKKVAFAATGEQCAELNELVKMF